MSHNKNGQTAQGRLPNPSLTYPMNSSASAYLSPSPRNPQAPSLSYPPRQPSNTSTYPSFPQRANLC